MRQIPEAELKLDFVRSSGPGGQNVNKTSTKVQLRWSVKDSPSFSDDEKQLIMSKLAQRLTLDGAIAIDVSETRSQLENKQRAVDLLNELVNEALTPEVPRVPTRPPRRSKLERLESKQKRSDVKKLRGSINLE